MLVLFAAMFLGVLLVAAKHDARNARARGRLSQIQLALWHYCEDYGCFPVVSSADSDATASVSWRVMLLPYFEMRDVYSRYDQQRDWNSPQNLALFRSSQSNLPGIFSSSVAGHDHVGMSDMLAVDDLSDAQQIVIICSPDDKVPIGCSSDLSSLPARRTSASSYCPLRRRVQAIVCRCGPSRASGTMGEWGSWAEARTDIAVWLDVVPVPPEN